MEGSNLRKTSSQRTFEGLPIKKIKRIQHIKSLPNHEEESVKKSSFSKIETRSKDEHQIKLTRFKTQHHSKSPYFGAVKTARERNIELARRKQHPSQPRNSLTKSTTYISPLDENEKRKELKCSKSRSKIGTKKKYSGMMSKMKQIMQEYQLKLDRFKQQKQEILKQNSRLKNQLEFLSRRATKVTK